MTPGREIARGARLVLRLGMVVAGLALGGASLAANELSVDDFGCAGDGITDDSACFARAFAELNSGGTVRLDRRKAYLLVTPPAIPPGVLVDGGNAAVEQVGKHFSYLPHSHSVGLFHIEGNPADKDYLYLNGSSVHFTTKDPVQTPAAHRYEVRTAASAAQTIANVIAFLNSSSDPQISKNTYAGAVFPQSQLVTGKVDIATIELTAKESGEAGNRFALSGSDKASSAGAFIAQVTPSMLGGGAPFLGGTIVLRDRPLVPGDGAAIRNAYIIRAGLMSPPAGPATMGDQIEHFSGVAIANTQGAQGWELANDMIVGFETAVVSTSGARIRIHGLRWDDTNGIDLAGSYDENEISDCASNNDYLGGQAALGLGQNVDIVSRRGTAYSIHEGSSGTKLHHLFDYGHAVFLSVNHEFGIECDSCSKDGTRVNPGIGVRTAGAIDRLVFANFRCDVQQTCFDLQGVGGRTFIVAPTLATAVGSPIRIDGPNVTIMGGQVGTGSFARPPGAPNLLITARGANTTIIGAAFDANPLAAPLNVDPAAAMTLCSMGNRFAAGGIPDSAGEVCPGLSTLTLPDLPTSDPHIRGRLWRQGQAVMVSGG